MAPRPPGLARSEAVIADERLDTLDPEQLRQAMRALMTEVARKDEVIARQQREAVLKQATQRPS